MATAGTDQGRRGWAPAAAAGAVAIVSAAIAWPFTCDDGAISFRFAEQAAAGNPLGTVTAGEPLVSGFSNPTWTLLLAAASRLGLPVTGTAKVLGVVCFALTAVVATRLIQRLVPRASLAWMGCAVGASCTVAIWSVSGLENPLVGLLVTATAYLLVAEEQDRRTGWRGLGSSAVIAALVVSRPDAFIYLGVAAVARAAATRRAASEGDGGVWLRAVAGDLVRWLAAPVLVLAAWTAFAVQRFGHPLANTVYAKVQLTIGERLTQLVDPGALPARQVAAFALATAALLLVPLALVGAWPRRTAATTVTILALGTLILPLSEADWMEDYRFFSTSVPLVVVLAAVGLDAIARWDEARRSSPARGPVTARLVTPVRFGMALVVLWAVINVSQTVQRAREDFAPQVTVAAVRHATEPIDQAGRRWGLDDPLVMTADAGAAVDDLDLRMLDMAGLLDPQVSHLIEDPDGRREYAFAERRPELVRAGYGSWSWNRMWGLAPGTMADLGYLRLPGIDEPSYLRRDLVVRPAETAGDAIRADQLQVPAAATGGQVTVRAWIAAPGSERDARVRIRLRRAAPAGGPVAETTEVLGSGLVQPERWDEDEAVLHVVRLTPPAGAGPLLVQVDVLGADGEATPLGEERVAWGAGDVTAAAEVLGRSATDRPSSTITALEQLGDLEAAAPAQADVIAAQTTRLRASGLEALRVQLAGDLEGSPDLAALETARRAIAPIRGRAAPDNRWSDLARDLQDRAASSAREDRYRLLVVAAAADPSSPSIQRDLLAARAARPSRLASTPTS